MRLHRLIDYRGIDKLCIWCYNQLMRTLFVWRPVLLHYNKYYYNIVLGDPGAPLLCCAVSALTWGAWRGSLGSDLREGEGLPSSDLARRASGFSTASRDLGLNFKGTVPLFWLRGLKKRVELNVKIRKWARVIKKKARF